MGVVLLFSIISVCFYLSGEIMRICLYGAPTSGKSTVAAWLFSQLKQKGFNIELVSEYIKAWAWEKRKPMSFDQAYIFAKQLHAEDVILRQGKHSVHIVTDSPLPLQLVYAKYQNCKFVDQLQQISKLFDNDNPTVNIFLKLRKDADYSGEGRIHEPHELLHLECLILNLLSSYGLPYIDATCVELDKILDYVKEVMSVHLFNKELYERAYNILPK